MGSDVPHFDAVGGTTSQGTQRRHRAWVLAAGAVLLAVAAGTVANIGRRSLECIDATLVPHRGQWLPLGAEPLADARFPPLSVTDGECEDESFSSASDFETRYYEIAMGRAGEAIRTEDSAGLEAAVDALARLPRDADGVLARQYTKLVESLLQADVELALERREHALRRIEQARGAGIDPEVIAAAERALRVSPGEPVPTDTTQAEGAANDQPPAEADLVLEPAPQPRSL